MVHFVSLDSGHASNTPGKKSPDGWREWKFNDDMQKRIKPRLEAHGIRVHLTNPNPSTVADISLSARANSANAWFKSNKCTSSNALLVSLHANAAGNAGQWLNARGVETHRHPSAYSQSINAATKIRDAIFNDVYNLVDKGFKKRSVFATNLGVLRNSNYPCCLIEYGFYDNKQDLNILKNHQDVLCEATVKGICAHFGIQYKEPTQSQPEQESFLVKIICDELNIREDASFSSKVVGVVTKNQVFTIVEVKNGLGKLKSGAGWISMGSKYVQKV